MQLFQRELVEPGSHPTGLLTTVSRDYLRPLNRFDESMQATCTRPNKAT
ncbi:MAG: hypothetical protein ACR2N1_22700 [Rubripirellula sp.]